MQPQTAGYREWLGPQGTLQVAAYGSCFPCTPAKDPTQQFPIFIPLLLPVLGSDPVLTMLPVQSFLDCALQHTAAGIRGWHSKPLKQAQGLNGTSLFAPGKTFLLFDWQVCLKGLIG